MLGKVKYSFKKSCLYLADEVRNRIGNVRIVHWNLVSTFKNAFVSISVILGCINNSAGTTWLGNNLEISFFDFTGNATSGKCRQQLHRNTATCENSKINYVKINYTTLKYIKVRILNT